MAQHYDLIAIGGGSGGLSVAERASRYGARCAVIEAGRLGGTCVNVGCVPKKIMWYAALLAHALDDAPGYGFRLDYFGFDWQKLKTARDGYVRNINEWYLGYLADAGVELIRGFARFTDIGTLEVGGETLTADHIIIATGGRPASQTCPAPNSASRRTAFSNWTPARRAWPSPAAVISPSNWRGCCTPWGLKSRCWSARIRCCAPSTSCSANS